MLPSPPSGLEPDLYLHSDRKLLLSLAIPSFLILSVGMVYFCTLHWVFAVIYGPYAFLVISYLSLSYWVSLKGKDFKEGERQVWGKHPSVDVFLPCAGEPIDVLCNTYKYVSQIAYQNIRVWVLDDGGSVEVERAARSFGFEYLSRPEPRLLKKAGNLRHAFQYTSGDFILILDADFVPRADIILKLLPYMKPDTAIVQSPQYFDCVGTSTQKGAAYVQELFYRFVQVNRDALSAPICVGSCALYRRSALQPFGGTYQIGFSEDVHTGWQLMEAGWKVRYVPHVLAKGLCPDTLRGFFVQQYRWCLGSLTLCCNKQFWTGNLTWAQRACFVTGFGYYVATAISVLLSPLPPVLMIWLAPAKIHWWSSAAAIPSLLFGTLGMGLWNSHPFGWHSLRARCVQSWAHLSAVVDKLFDRAVAWVPTGAVQRATFSRFQVYRVMAWVYSVTLLSLYVFGISRVQLHVGLLPTSLLFLFGIVLTLLSFHEE